MKSWVLAMALLGAGLLPDNSNFAVAGQSKREVMVATTAQVLANSCTGCHGTDGVSRGPATPSIAGLSKEYFEEVMTGFKTGSVPSTIMGRMARGYSENQIKLMADYFSRQAFVSARQNFDADLVAKGAKLHNKYCKKCHANAGQAPEDEAGFLGGQWTPYLKATLADYIAGRREMTKKMREKTEKMLKKEGYGGMRALFAFYASQQ